MPRDSAPLTDAAINAAKPKRSRYRMADGAGLCLLVEPDGSKSWTFRYRFDGNERGLSFGAYPAVTLKEARHKREAARRLIREGKDPSAERKAGKRSARHAATNSFETVARGYLDTRGAAWTPGYAKTAKARLEKNVFPFIGSRPIAGIKRPELVDTIRKIEARGAIDMARRMADLCRLVFEHGMATGACENNPAHGLRKALKPHVKRPRPHVKPGELPATASSPCALRQIARIERRAVAGGVRAAETTAASR